MPRIHLNNSGASLPRPEVVDAMIDHLRAEAELGPNEAAAANEQGLERLYAEAAQLIGALPTEIAWHDSGSRAWATAVQAFDWRRGDRIIVSRLDFGGSLATLVAVAERAGASVEVGPCDPFGQLVPDALEPMMDGVAAIAVSHAAAHSGATNDVAALGALARSAGARFLGDAAQSIGQMPVSVTPGSGATECDALVATGRKWLRGPRGSAFLYLDHRTTRGLTPRWGDPGSVGVTPPVAGTTTLAASDLVWRDDARRFELWERSQAAAVGLGVAVAQLNADVAAGTGPYGHIAELARRCRDGLAANTRAKVWGPPDPASGIVGFEVAGATPAAIRTACAAVGITISVTETGVAPLDFAAGGVTQLCRVAPNADNTTADVDAFLSVVGSS